MSVSTGRRVWVRWAAVLGAVALVGCGKVKSRDERLVVVGEPPASAPAPAGEESAQKSPDSSGGETTEEKAKKITEIYELYADADGVDKEQLNNIVTKIEGKPANPGTVDTLFGSDSNGNGKVTLGEVLNGMYSNIPTMKWILQGESLNRQELAARVKADYPEASDTALGGMVDALFRYDETWTGGNGDGRLSRLETEYVGIIIGQIAKSGLGSLPGAGGEESGNTSVVGVVIEQKKAKQVFGRYGEIRDFSKLSKADASLEEIQVGIRFWLCVVMTEVYGGVIEPAKQAEALATLGFGEFGEKPDGWKKLREAYDNKPFGDRDGALGEIELFNLVSDLDFAKRVISRTGGDLSHTNIMNVPDVAQVAALLNPRTGRDLVMVANKDENGAIVSYSPRKEYWDDLIRFDNPKRSGDGDGGLSSAELATAFLDALLLEGIFTVFDQNRDGSMQKDESFELMRLFELESPKTVDLFYSEAALHPNASVPALLALKKKKKSELAPFDFYRRMEILLDRGQGGLPADVE